MAAKMFVFFILGIILLILGYIMQVVEAGIGLWSGTAYILGVLSLLLYTVKNRSELRILFTRRSARYGAVSVVFILAFVGILVVVGLFSERHNYRWDLTESKTHSIALQSRQQLERLDSDTLDLNVYICHRGERDQRHDEDDEAEPGIRGVVIPTRRRFGHEYRLGFRRGCRVGRRGGVWRSGPRSRAR